mgnify:CR=1 FL=1
MVDVRQAYRKRPLAGCGILRRGRWFGVGLGEFSRTNSPDTTLGVVFAECILGTVGNRVKAQ